MSEKLRFGQILVRAGVIEREIIEQATRVWHKAGGELGELLVEHKLIDEAVMLQAIGRALKLPCVSLESITPDPGALRRIPRDLCLRYLVFPIEIERTRTGQHLHVAMANPSNITAIRNLTRVARVRIRPMVTSTREIRAAIVRFMGGRGTREIAVEPSTTGGNHVESRPGMSGTPVATRSGAATPVSAPRPEPIALGRVTIGERDAPRRPADPPQPRPVPVAEAVGVKPHDTKPAQARPVASAGTVSTGPASSVELFDFGVVDLSAYDDSLAEFEHSAGAEAPQPAASSDAEQAPVASDRSAHGPATAAERDAASIGLADLAPPFDLDPSGGIGDIEPPAHAAQIGYGELDPVELGAERSAAEPQASIDPGGATGSEMSTAGAIQLDANPADSMDMDLTPVDLSARHHDSLELLGGVVPSGSDSPLMSAGSDDDLPKHDTAPSAPAVVSSALGDGDVESLLRALDEIMLADADGPRRVARALVRLLVARGLVDAVELSEALRAEFSDFGATSVGAAKSATMDLDGSRPHGSYRE